MIERESAGSSVGGVLRSLVRHPGRHLVRRWNWKSAILSSLTRSSLFFVANIGAGFPAARAAFLTELVFRATTAGFYGALTPAFRDVQPPARGTLAGMIILPATAHLLEFSVHSLRGTERLAASLFLSIAFTALSTSFNLFAMRRGVLVVGDGCESLWHDLRRVPTLVVEFGVGIVRRLFRFA